MSKTKSTAHKFRKIVLAVLCTVAACTPSASAQATFRVVSYVNQLQQPVGITEGSPGVFYSFGGSIQSVFSVTTQGSKTVLASFPSGHNILAPLVSAANGRLYSAVTYMLNPVNAFSVGPSAGSKRLYSPQQLGFLGSERESDETATFTQLSSPAELRGTDVGHRHPLGDRKSEEHTSELQSPCNLVC